MQKVTVKCWLDGASTKNLGEWFCEMIFEAMGVEMEYHRPQKREPEGDVWLVIGSEFHQGMVDGLLKQYEHVHVWGQGNGCPWMKPVNMQEEPYRSRVKIHALRGPLTQRVSNFLLTVPLCDPGFLLPYVLPYLSRCGNGGEVLYIPHNTARKSGPAEAERLGAIYVDCMIHRDSLDDTLKRLLSANFVLTSALHALIFCLAYGIPCAPYLAEGEKWNMPAKWRDTYESLGVSVPNLQQVTSLDEGRQWYGFRNDLFCRLPDTDAMLKSFPRSDQ